MKVEEIVIIWINDIKNKTRYDHMVSQLETHFPHNKKIHVDAIIESPKYNGVSMAHMVAVLKGINKRKPFLVLEDDVSIDSERVDFLKLEKEKDTTSSFYNLGFLIVMSSLVTNYMLFYLLPLFFTFAFKGPFSRIRLNFKFRTRS